MAIPKPQELACSLTPPSLDWEDFPLYSGAVHPIGVLQLQHTKKLNSRLLWQQLGNLGEMVKCPCTLGHTLYNIYPNWGIYRQHQECHLPVILYSTRPLSPLSWSVALIIKISTGSRFSGNSRWYWSLPKTGTLSFSSTTVMCTLAFAKFGGIPPSLAYTTSHRRNIQRNKHSWQSHQSSD